MAAGPCAGLRGYPGHGPPRLSAADTQQRTGSGRPHRLVSRGCLVIAWSTHLREPPSGGRQKELLTLGRLHHAQPLTRLLTRSRGWWSLVVTESCPREPELLLFPHSF